MTRQEAETWIDKWADSYEWRKTVAGNPTEVETLLSELRALEDSYETQEEVRIIDWEVVRKVLEDYSQQGWND